MRNLKTFVKQELKNKTMEQTVDTTQLVEYVADAAKHGEVSLVLLAICGVLGAALHFFKKAKRLRKDPNWDAAAFWKSETLSILCSLIVVAFALIAKENIQQLKIAGYVAGIFMYFTFFMIGYFGDSLVDYFLGGFEKKLEEKNRD
jgi:uncharacterized membrane protein